MSALKADHNTAGMSCARNVARHRPAHLPGPDTGDVTILLNLRLTLVLEHFFAPLGSPLKRIRIP